VLLPQIQADAVLADKAYHAQERVMAVLEAKGQVAVIPPKANHVHPKAYDKELYKERNHIERFFQKLKQYRCIATRYDKTAACFLGGIYLASIVIWLH
jgi:transposase